MRELLLAAAWPWADESEWSAAAREASCRCKLREGGGDVTLIMSGKVWPPAEEYAGERGGRRSTHTL